MATAPNLDALRVEFSCPISFELMQDPVRETACGHVFEKRWIREWIGLHGNCPLLPLTLENLHDHDAIRGACAILDPARVEPLSDEELEIVQGALRALRERREDDAARVPLIPARVDPAAHDSILARLKAVAVATTRATGEFYRY